MQRRFIRTGLCAAAALALLVCGLAAARQPQINVSRGLALHGYDAVAYFSDGKPVVGQGAFSYSWSGATWRFASASNRDRFAADPGKYAPQFGGYCAYAVSQGHTADGDPQLWRIVNGQLFLNYSAEAKRLWELDVPGNIAKGRQNWPGVLGK